MKYLLLLLSLNANASILTLTDSTDTLMDVQLHESATYKSTKMTAQDAQLVSKKVGLVNVKIMVVEKFNQDKLLAVRMTFLRTVNSEVMKLTIDDYLSNNLTEIDHLKYELDINKLLGDIESDDSIEQDKVISVVGDRKNNEIVYENTEGKVFVNSISNVNLINKIFGLWFSL